VKGSYTLENGAVTDASDKHKPVSDDYYYIVPDKCTECTGFHEEPQCAAVCPVDCCVPDPDVVETKEVLLLKKEKLHL
jgi:ferredoxin